MKSNIKRLLILSMAAIFGMVEVANAFYDPGLQRWINRDPIGEVGGINLYGFAVNAPTSWVDLWGLSGCDTGDPWLDDMSDATTMGGGLARQMGFERGRGLAIEAGQAVAENLGNVAVEAATLPLGGPGKGALAKKAAPKTKGAWQALKDVCNNLFKKKAAKGGNGLGNPFKGKTAAEIDEMFKAKGFEPRGPDPLNGKGGYVNPKTGRSYHIDEANSFGEPPHVDVNRPKTYDGPLDKKKYPFGN